VVPTLAEMRFEDGGRVEGSGRLGIYVDDKFLGLVPINVLKGDVWRTI